MGGLVARWFVAKTVPLLGSPGAYLSNTVHQMITVGTPHIGSDLANVLVKHEKDGIVVPGIATVAGAICKYKQIPCTLESLMSSMGRDVGAGGAAALEVGSNDLQALNAAPRFPYRTITGIAPAGSLTEAGLGALLLAFQPASERSGNLPSPVSDVLGTQHDTIVGSASQSYLAPAQDSATVSGIVHTAMVKAPTDVGETSSPDVWNQLYFWLTGGQGTAPAGFSQQEVSNVQSSLRSLFRESCCRYERYKPGPHLGHQRIHPGSRQYDQRQSDFRNYHDG